MEHEERSERLVRRIEAFSDLVMGFSIALLGLTLVIPLHAITLVLHRFWLVSYFWTFALIAFLWMRHQRLFSRYFVPTTFCIMTNFVFLSMLGLIVYFVQVYAHVRGEFDQAIALIGYFGAFAIAMICLGTLFALGTRLRWNLLSQKDRFTGFANAARGLILGPAVLLGCVAAPVLHLELRWSSPYTLAGFAVGGVVAAAMYVRYKKTRIFGTAHAGA